MKKITVVLNILILLLAIPLLSAYSYLFFFKLFNDGILLIITFNPDVFFSNWIFWGILAYASILALLNKANANFYFQIALIGLILDLIMYKLVYNFYYYPNIFLVIYSLLLIFFNLKKVKKENGWSNISKKSYFAIFGINIFIISVSMLYYYYNYWIYF